MTTHTFTLIIDGPDLQIDELVDEVFEAGCDDAVVCRADETQFADFDREADTLQDALESAVSELECIGDITMVRLVDGCAREDLGLEPT